MNCLLEQGGARTGLLTTAKAKLSEEDQEREEAVEVVRARKIVKCLEEVS